MSIGDNLNDFLSVFTCSNPERSEHVKKLESSFGTNYIVLPNPVYGDWNMTHLSWDWD